MTRGPSFVLSLTRQWGLAALAGVVLGSGLASCGGKVAEGDAPGSGGGASGRTPPGSTGANGAPPGVPPSGRLGGRPETCADNPLLAGCQATTPPITLPPPEALEPVTPIAQQGGPTTLALVEDALYMRCGSCHGGEPSTGTCDTCFGMYVENVRRLVEGGMILPCNWQGSPLYQRIADGSMPPPASGQRGLSARQESLVGGFVDGLCAELSQPVPGDTLRIELERWLATDCSECHGAAADAGAGPSGIDGQNDLAELIADGYLVPCSPEGSALLGKLSNPSMPSPGHEVRAALQRQLRTFIGRPCSRR